MKRIATIAAFAAFAATAADFSGTYSIWHGYLSGFNSTGDRSEMLGAGAGGESSGLVRTDLVGAAAGAFATNLTDCVGIGYHALRGSSGMSRVVAIGANALTNRPGESCSTWINGQLYASAQGDSFWLKPNPSMPDTNAPIYYANGTLHLNAEVSVNGGTLSGGGGSGGSSAPSLSGYDLYVDPVSGDDSFSGTTAATAKRTIDAAYSLVTNHGASICLMPGTHQSPSGGFSAKNSYPDYRVRFAAPYGPGRTTLDGGGVRCLTGCQSAFTTVDGCTLSGFIASNVNWHAFFGISFTNCVFEGDLYQSSFSSRTPFDSCLFFDCQMDIARTVSNGYTNMNGSAAFFSGCEAYDSRFIVANTNDNSRAVFSSGSVFRNCYIWAENASKFAVYYTSVLGNAAAFRDSTLICPSAITNDGSVAASGCLIGIGTNGSEYAWGRATNSVLTDAATLSASLGGDLRPAVTNWKYRFLGYGSEGDRALRDSMLESIRAALSGAE